MFIWYFMPLNDHYVTPLINGPNNDTRYVYNINNLIVIDFFFTS